MDDETTLKIIEAMSRIGHPVQIDVGECAYDPETRRISTELIVGPLLLTHEELDKLTDEELEALGVERVCPARTPK